MNLTATSNGTQFDRLAIISFEGVEIWRTSTPEPSAGDGIIWTYIKDASRYIPLLTKPGTLQLELDNLLSDPMGLNGQYDVRFSVTYFQSSPQHPPALQSNEIIGLTNITSVPPDFSTSVTFPRNMVQAYAELFASGNGNEEFWYFNAADQFIGDLPNGTTFPDGPFREVRMLVDNQLAGVAFPYPVFFTGAITPNTWRPITSYGALELPTYFVDLTPFVPILADGNPHNITLDVVSAEADHAINANWFVSGLIQIVTDNSTNPTTGTTNIISAPAFANTSITGSSAANGDVNITVTATRSIHIEANITSGSGQTNQVVWKQDLQYSNVQTYQDNTLIQNVVQQSSGQMLSTHNGKAALSDKFQYPMTIDLTSTVNFTNTTAHYDHSYDRTLLPSPLVVESTIANRQIATGLITFLPNGSHTGAGNNSNTFSYSDAAGNTFNRNVTSIMNDIIQDDISGTLANDPQVVPLVAQGTSVPQSATGTFAVRGPGGKRNTPGDTSGLGML